MAWTARLGDRQPCPLGLRIRPCAAFRARPPGEPGLAPAGTVVGSPAMAERVSGPRGQGWRPARERYVLTCACACFGSAARRPRQAPRPRSWSHSPAHLRRSREFETPRLGHCLAARIPDEGCHGRASPGGRVIETDTDRAPLRGNRRWADCSMLMRARRRRRSGRIRMTMHQAGALRSPGQPTRRRRRQRKREAKIWCRRRTDEG